MTRDPIILLTEIRPHARRDALWSADEEQRLTAEILATPRTSTPARSPRRRRVVTVVVAGAVLSVVGVGVASAGGFVPQRFTEDFGYWKTFPVEGNDGIDPADAERVGTTAGPDGTLFTMLVAYGEDGYRCVAGMVESGPPGSPDYSVLATTGSVCRAGSNTQSFGPLGVEYPPDLDYAFYTGSAGSAIRADVRTAEGLAPAPILVDGEFWGWIPKPELGEPPAVMTGYDIDGGIIGSAEL